jgi:hypothetical protein
MISIAAVEVSYRQSMLWRFLGNPIAFTCSDINSSIAVTLVLGNQVQIWLARCFTSGDVFDFISLTTFQPKFFRDLWPFIVGTGFTVVSLLANANGMSTGKLRRPSVGASREPTIFSEHCDCRS